MMTQQELAARVSKQITACYCCLIVYAALNIIDLVTTYIAGPGYETNSLLRGLWLRYGFWSLIAGKILLVTYVAAMAHLFIRLRLHFPAIVLLSIQLAFSLCVVINNVLFLILYRI